MIIVKLENTVKEIKVLFGMRMKELRKNRGLSQEGLAESVNISSKYLSRVEMGQHFPSIETLGKLADALGVELKDLFEFTHTTDSTVELRDTLKKIIKDAEDEKLRLLVKIAKAVTR